MESDEHVDKMNWGTLRAAFLELRAERDRLRAELAASKRVGVSQIIGSDKATTAADSLPLFEVGKCYRTRGGLVTCPIEFGPQGLAYKIPYEPKHTIHVWPSGLFHEAATDERDLLPGAVDPPPLNTAGSTATAICSGVSTGTLAL
jgi:hypothetical protein